MKREQLEAIKRRAEDLKDSPLLYPAIAYDVPALVAEVERLRGLFNELWDEILSKRSLVLGGTEVTVVQTVLYEKVIREALEEK